MNHLANQPPDAPAPPLAITDLRKSYGRVLALEKVSLEVPAGSVYGLLGLNGAGKTTTLECALGLLRPDSGSCRILGYPAARIHRTRGRVGVVFDQPSLWGHLTVEGNLEACRHYLAHRLGHHDHPRTLAQPSHSGRGRWRETRELLACVGLERVRRRLARKLSLGMARRLAVARAILGEPELVVMDEPLAGLDTAGVETVLELIRTLNHQDGVTFVLSSHRLFEMQDVCDRVGLIHDGRVLTQGELADLLARRRGRLRLRALPSDRAHAFLESRPGVDTVRLLCDGLFEIGLREITPAQLNAEMVREGLAVSELVECRSTLHGLFRELTETAGRTGATGAVSNPERDLREASP